VFLTTRHTFLHIYSRSSRLQLLCIVQESSDDHTLDGLFILPLSLRVSQNVDSGQRDIIRNMFSKKVLRNMKQIAHNSHRNGQTSVFNTSSMYKFRPWWEFRQRFSLFTCKLHTIPLVDLTARQILLTCIGNVDSFQHFLRYTKDFSLKLSMSVASEKS
jgi:hypothetical protein